MLPSYKKSPSFDYEEEKDIKTMAQKIKIFFALLTLLSSVQDVDDVIADVDEQLENTWDKDHQDEKGEFELLEKAPSYHHFISAPAGGVKPSTAAAASVPASVAEFVMKKDIPLLRSSLPAGIKLETKLFTYYI